MNVAARIGLAVGGLAVGAGAAKLFNDVSADRYAKDTANVAAQTSAARAEWTEFSEAVEAEFPGMELYSREDHARFEQFLQDHPAPEWVDVEHEGFTRVHMSTNGFLDDSVHRPIGQETAYPIGFGGFIALGSGAAAVHNVIRSPASTWGTIGGTAGAAALAGIGVGMILSGINTGRFDSTAFKGASELVREVNANA